MSSRQRKYHTQTDIYPTHTRIHISIPTCHQDTGPDNDAEMCKVCMSVRVWLGMGRLCFDAWTLSLCRRVGACLHVWFSDPQHQPWLEITDLKPAHRHSLQGRAGELRAGTVWPLRYLPYMRQVSLGMWSMHARACTHAEASAAAHFWVRMIIWLQFSSTEWLQLKSLVITSHHW